MISRRSATPWLRRDQSLHLIGYLLVLIGIVGMPGMDMAFVLSKTLTGGWRSGSAALAGIVTGGLAHCAMAALGVGGLVSALPLLFNAMLVLGALYVGWIGMDILRHGAALTAVAGAKPTSHWRTVRDGVVTCLLNPKAYLFMFAIFPQFLRPGAGSIGVQMLVMTAMLVSVQIAIYGAVVLGGAGARERLARSARAQRLVSRGVGVMLIMVAAWGVAAAWR